MGRSESACSRECLMRSQARYQRLMERTEALARPTPRRLRSLWDDKCAVLPPDRRDKIKSALEEDYFLSPEQTEQYFQSIGPSRLYVAPEEGQGVAAAISKGKPGQKKECKVPCKDLMLRRKWLIDFSAQVAFRLCEYISKENKDILVSNRLRSIADVVLEKVAEILGESKPTRSNPGRLARFMVAVSDRIAVWIENAVYRADALEITESQLDEHIRLDAEKPFV